MMHALRIRDAPLFANSDDQNGQLINTRRLGNYCLVTKFADGHATINGVEIYDLNTDNFEYLGLDKLMQGIPFLEQAQATLAHLPGLYLALITNAYRCFQNEGLVEAAEADRKLYPGQGGVIPVEQLTSNPDPYILKFRNLTAADRRAYVFQNAKWHEFFYLYDFLQARIRRNDTPEALKRIIQKTFEALMAITTFNGGADASDWISRANLDTVTGGRAPCVRVVEAARVALDAPADAAAVAGATPASIAAAVAEANANFEASRMVYLGKEEKQATPERMSTTARAILIRTVTALTEDLGGAFTYLLRPSGSFARTANTLGNLSAYLNGNTLLQILSMAPMPLAVAPKVYLLNLEEMLSGYKMMRKEAAKKESWYTEALVDNVHSPKDNWGSLKTTVTIFTAQSYFDHDGDFLCIRPADTQKFARFIMMTAGEATAYAVMSPPYFSRGEDAGTQSFFLNNTMYQGVHIADFRKIRCIPDSMYAGCVGGSNTRIFTWKEAVEFRKSGFAIKGMEDPSMYVIPIRRGEFHHDSFLFLRGRPEIPGGEKFTGQYSYCYTWSALHHWDTCTPEYTWVDNRKKVLATVCFPTTYRYTNQSGVLVPKYGGTHHGAYGECPGAQEVRMLGEKLYAREIQVE
jgi:hypothetical protein